MELRNGMEFFQLTGKVHIGWENGWRRVNLCERYESMFNFDAKNLGMRYDNESKICKICIRLYKKGAYIPFGESEGYSHGNHYVGGYGSNVFG